MKKLLVLVAAAALLISVNSFAQIDPDDDGVGIYFDPCACGNCVTLPEGTHYAWLVITHPTSPDGVHGWECRVETEGPLFVLDWAVQGLAVNADTPPSFVVGLAEPMLAMWMFPTVVVMEITFLLTDVTPAHFYLEPVQFPSIPDELVYVDGGDINNLIIMRQSTGGPGEPVATINGDCPVALEDATWGHVKNLYR